MFEFCENSEESEVCIIMLHGFGANKEDLFPLKMNFPGAKVVSLQAPISLAPQGYFGGYAWFSLDFTPQGIIYNEEEAEEVLVQLHETVKQYRNKYSKLIVCGFSQGSILTHGLLLRYPGLLDGAICLSGRFSEFIFSGADTEHLTGKPVFISHGSHDEVIPVESGKQIIEFYQKSPCGLTADIYSMGHDISYECQLDLKEWYQSHFIN